MAGFLLIWILIAIILFAIVGFLNPGVYIASLNLLFTEYSNVSLLTVIFFAFLAGFLYALIISIIQEFRLRMKIRKLRNMQDSLLEELDTLRRAPIERIKTEEDDDVS